MTFGQKIVASMRLILSDANCGGCMVWFAIALACAGVALQQMVRK